MPAPNSARRKRTALERVFRVRLENLRRIISANFNGNKAALARALDNDRSFIVQLAGDNPTRVIGEKLARDIEVKLGLVSGWLDMIH
jgi:hypothetical protein